MKTAMIIAISYKRNLSSFNITAALISQLLKQCMVLAERLV